MDFAVFRHALLNGDHAGEQSVAFASGCIKACAGCQNPEEKTRGTRKANPGTGARSGGRLVGEGHHAAWHVRVPS